jgi:ERCC4-type nuclease
VEKGGTISVMMDHREVNEDLRQTLLLDPTVHLEINALRTGDFLINDLLLVERKTFRDFVSSIKDGRIFKQAARLASNSKPSLIILEGTSQDIKSSGMKREAIQGALICLSMKFRIPVLRSLSPIETGKLMIAAYHQLTTFNRHLPYRPSPFKRDGKLKQQVFILQGLPGVGPSRAKLLLDRFDSLRAVFNASVSDMKVAKGIGTYTAEQIYSVLHERFLAYL